MRSCELVFLNCEIWLKRKLEHSYCAAMGRKQEHQKRSDMGTCTQRCSKIVTRTFCMQRWDAQKHEEENGVYLGHIASLCFVGPWEMKAVRFRVHLAQSLPCCHLKGNQALSNMSGEVSHPCSLLCETLRDQSSMLSFSSGKDLAMPAVM